MHQKPLFNKRLYKAQAGIAISKQASEILQRDPKKPRNKTELLIIRPIVSGLKEIHKNLEFVKTALSHAITFKKHESNITIEKESHETQMSCYYILFGSVESLYSVKNENTTNTNGEEELISYTNIAGDYIGLLSADGPNFDLPTPEFIATIGNCEFLRIDRAIFHEKIEEGQKQFRCEITRFLNENSLFREITEDDQQKLVGQMVKQEFSAGKEILIQGQKQEHAFFVVEGSYFDASCVIDGKSSKYSVYTVGLVTCFLLNKWTMKNTESLLLAMKKNRPKFPNDEELKSLVKESNKWQNFKRECVCLAKSSKPKSQIMPQLRRVDRQRKQTEKEDTKMRANKISSGSNLANDNRMAKKCKGLDGETKSFVQNALLSRRSRKSKNSNKKDVELEKQTDENIANRTKILEHSSKKQSVAMSYSKICSANTQNSSMETQLVDGYSERHSVDGECKYVGMDKDKTSTKVTTHWEWTNTSLSQFENHSLINLEDTTEAKAPNIVLPTHKMSEERPKRGEHWVSSEKKFKVKEIVNMKLPSRRTLSNMEYRRHEPSMFSDFDYLKKLEIKTDVDPFVQKEKNRQWLRDAKKRFAYGGRKYSPGKSPIIVIEELCLDMKDKENNHELKATRLQTLHEDKDEENIAASKNVWATSIHESHFEAAQSAEKAKSDIAELKNQLIQLGWTHKMLAEQTKKRREIRRNISVTSNTNGETEDEKDFTENLDKKTTERKHKVLRRQVSIHKILEGHSGKSYRRHKSAPDAKSLMGRRISLSQQCSTALFGEKNGGRTIKKRRNFTVS
ncbi:uncharacterized protein LOC124443822 isoform X3 [Xenia sp. Carnegie-2017]|uniref:uncharacterized protein LOC124443822 isoform X3 n=1 Tax=Xenia sp. Carnegie-2017 TaxID=2897299 RepID=UPI001F03FA82|nr:uncharacterized protein LOC124443822 isoform X3 [Xenia sp. Carnegie-2017]